MSYAKSWCVLIDYKCFRDLLRSHYKSIQIQNEMPIEGRIMEIITSIQIGRTALGSKRTI